MNVASRLPSKPLNLEERKRLRAHNEIDALIVIGKTSIDERHEEQTENAIKMVVLTNGLIYALNYGESNWSKELLQRNADRQDHLERAFDQMDYQPSSY